jgi:hypothetical protein
MRYPLIIAAGSLLLVGCKPDESAQSPTTSKVESAAPAKSAVEQPPAPPVSKPPEVKLVPAYEPPAAPPTPKVDPAEDEKRKLHAYIREERIRQIEAAKSRVEALMRAMEPERIETDGEVLRALGLDPLTMLSSDWQATAQAYREQKAKARERQNRALEDAQAHLRSLLLGADEKTIAIPVR